MLGSTMKERIKEIIEYIMEAEAGAMTDSDGINNELESLGYSQDEIKQAMTILDLGIFKEDFESASAFFTRNRVLGKVEKIILSTEAQGYLINLQISGWLSETQLSFIIENAGMEYRIPVSMNEVREVASRLIPEIPEDILDGSMDSFESLN